MLVKLLLQNIPDTLKPDPTRETRMPGKDVITEVLSALSFVALAMCIAGIVLSAGMWAIGSFSNNYTQSVNGKKGFLISVASALFIGAAYVLVNGAYLIGNDTK